MDRTAPSPFESITRVAMGLIAPRLRASMEVDDWLGSKHSACWRRYLSTLLRVWRIDTTGSHHADGSSSKRSPGRGRSREPSRARFRFRSRGVCAGPIRGRRASFFLTDGKFAYTLRRIRGRFAVQNQGCGRICGRRSRFLIGNVDFQRDFKEFRTTPDGANTYIAATPKSARAPYTQVDFLVTRITGSELLKVTGQDGRS
jgi:hypothetical protein